MEKLLFVGLGIAVIRWIIPFIDILFELVINVVNNFVTSIAINIQKKQIEFQKKYENEVEESSLAKIGFKHEEECEEEYYEEEEDI